jgi:hypothetical protein
MLKLHQYPDCVGHLPGLQAMVSLALLSSDKRRARCASNFSCRVRIQSNASEAGNYFVVSGGYRRRRIGDSNYSGRFLFTQADHFAWSIGGFDLSVARHHDRAGCHVRLSPHCTTSQVASGPHGDPGGVTDHHLLRGRLNYDFPNRTNGPSAWFTTQRDLSAPCFYYFSLLQFEVQDRSNETKRTNRNPLGVISYDSWILSLISLQ